MKLSVVAAALVAAAALAAPTLALAKSRHHHHGYPISPYGYGTPSYSSRYGTYPSYTYDPDPNLRAQLRSDFNRGVDFPGNGR